MSEKENEAQTEDQTSAYQEPEEEKQARNTGKTVTLTARIFQKDKEAWDEIRKTHSNAAEAFSAAIHQEPEIREVEKRVEVPVEVPGKLSENQFVIELNEKQQRVLEIVGTKRAAKNGTSKPEAVGDLLVRAFFIRGRIFNFDNEFYTGLSKKDLAT